jgi:hypothetical protein
MESGAGPLPILMGGGAAQSSLRGGGGPGARSAGPNQDPIIDKFVHDYLADDLMKMNPVDGWVAEPAANWVLADDKADVVLIDARSGPTLTLDKALAHSSYRAIWFDPNTGTAAEPVALDAKAGVAIPKPNEKDWLLLLRAAR